MNIEVLTIGNELLLGFTPDTNAAEIARALSAAGVPLSDSTVKCVARYSPAAKLCGRLAS